MLTIYDLKTEYRKDPLGIDETQPGFSWKLRSDHRNVTQASYRLTVRCGDLVLWDSGLIPSAQQTAVIYAGAPLSPETGYALELTVQDDHGETAQATGCFETGLMDRGFTADFITHDFDDDAEPCAVFVRRFTAEEIAFGRLYISALGVYEARLNGEAVSPDKFSPGWTSYHTRIQYQTYDVTGLLKNGENILEVTVGNGWYKGIFGFFGQGSHYGKRTALIAELVLTGADGNTTRIRTDEDWRCTTGPVRYSEIYHGEVIDFTCPAEPERPVHLYPQDKSVLTAQEVEPMRFTRELPVQAVLTTPSGKTVLDFGQNMSGVVRARLTAPRGTKVVLRFGEAMEHGEIFRDNLRTARATDTFICSGEADEFVPSFTYHGFRYVEVEGLDTIDPEAFTALHLHTDFARGLAFSCSDPDIEKLWRNIDWTFRSNYLDVPMDCPQRDERMGYTGDAQIFLPTALYHGDLALFYHKWLRDLQADQSPEGAVPLTVPDYSPNGTCVNIWHDAAGIVPWQVYETYGDARILREQYESMKAAVEYNRRQAGEGGLLDYTNSAQFGDWVALDAPMGPHRDDPYPRTDIGLLNPPQSEKIGATDPWFLGNVYYLNSIDLLRRTAQVLGETDDAAEYDALYEKTLAAIRGEFITASGRLVTETQTALALAVYFGIAEGKAKERALEKLEMNLIGTGKHLMTGFVGTEYLPHVLSGHGMHALFGDILFKRDCPSWLYEVDLGATTIWELWDGVEPDGSIHRFEMNSLNQYGFGTVGNWLYTELAGVTPLEPGFKKIRIAPRLVRGITQVALSLETVYGQVGVEYSCRDGKAECLVTIPVGTTAVVSLEGMEEKELGSGEYSFMYDLDRDYVRRPYSEDTTLGALMAIPACAALFTERFPELASSGLVRFFASGRSVVEIEKTMRVFPPAAVETLHEMIDLANREAVGE